MDKNKTKSIYFDRETEDFVGVDEDVLAGLHKIYPKVNIAAEIERMKVWLVEKGKRHKGTFGFILNWLTNAIPTNSTTEMLNHMQEINEDPILREHLQEYISEIWKTNDSLFQFNKIKR